MANPIDSKTKRDRLAPRREPYWVRLRTGLFVGYRKLTNGDGTWIARWRNDEGKQKTHALGTYDRYDTAEQAAREWAQNCELGASTTATSVKRACEAYVNKLSAESRTAASNDAKGRFRRLVDDKRIGRLALDKLRTTHVTEWMNDQIDRSDTATEDSIRRSKDTANRNLATLKAALNLALRNRLVATDAGWKTVQSFSRVGERRNNAFLTIGQRTALIAAAPPDLQLFMTAMLHTGARPGDLARMNVANYNPALGTITLTGKTRTRTTGISTAAKAFFDALVANKDGNLPMLQRADGTRWDKDAWKYPFKDAAAAVSLPDDVVMYSLRHTAISEWIRNGIDTFQIAKMVGTSMAMIEKHYGHLRHADVTARLDQIRIV